MKLLRTRPRRLAVALFALGGTVVGIGGAVVPAQATPEDWECVRYSVWTYESQRGKTWHAREACLVPTPLDASGGSIPVGEKSDVPPEGTPSGAGVEVWPPTP